MSAIHINWTETPREGLVKQGEFKIGYNTYNVEHAQDGNLTITNRMDASQIRFNCDPGHLLVMGGGVIKINGTGFDHSRSKLVYYLAELNNVQAEDVQGALRCDEASAQAIVSEIFAAA